jgi:4a-hydroxytetrahydrobiopterin dehydratase
MEASKLNELATKRCRACEDGLPRLRGTEVKKLKQALGREWKVVKGHHLHRVFKFPDFQSALDFVNRVGRVAERQGHHPDIELGWGRVGISISTHSIDGLSENDFVLAARIEMLPRK